MIVLPPSEEMNANTILANDWLWCELCCCQKQKTLRSLKMEGTQRRHKVGMCCKKWAIKAELRFARRIFILFPLIISPHSVSYMCAVHPSPYSLVFQIEPIIYANQFILTKRSQCEKKRFFAQSLEMLIQDSVKYCDIQIDCEWEMLNDAIISYAYKSIDVSPSWITPHRIETESKHIRAAWTLSQIEWKKKYHHMRENRAPFRLY